jgi:protease-4
MQPIADLLIDRRRLKRQLLSWRVIALLAVFALSALYFSGFAGGKMNTGGIAMEYVAQVNLEGVMYDDPELNDILDEIRDSKHVKAVIVKLDSPGGTTVAGEVAYLKLKEIAAKKPVVGVMHTLCASACYMAALGTNHVIARHGTLTGSIGVLLQSIEISKLTEMLGITPITIKSGEMKDVPSMTEPFTPEQRRVVGELVSDAYDHFVRLIVVNRKLDEETVRTLADGRVYTGNQAVQLKLIDGLGGMDEARTWLQEKHKISKDLKLREMKPQPEFETVWEQLGQVMGIKFLERNALGLDGLVSIWHPSLTLNR